MKTSAMGRWWEMFEQRRQFLELFTLASVNEERCARELAVAGGVELGKNRDQLDGKIVDAIEAHILKRVEDGALPRAGKSGEDDELAGFGAVGEGGGGVGL